MDLDTLGKKILEAIAVRGKIVSTEREVNEINSIINENNKKVKKFQEEIKAENDVAKKKADSLCRSFEELKIDLTKRLAELKANGADINIGATSPKNISI